MEWKQIGKRMWLANYGGYQFLIEQCCGRFWARYSHGNTSCKLKPHKKLKAAQAECEKVLSAK